MLPSMVISFARISCMKRSHLQDRRIRTAAKCALSLNTGWVIKQKEKAAASPEALTSARDLKVESALRLITAERSIVKLFHRGTWR